MTRFHIASRWFSPWCHELQRSACEWTETAAGRRSETFSHVFRFHNSTATLIDKKTEKGGVLMVQSFKVHVWLWRPQSMNGYVNPLSDAPTFTLTTRSQKQKTLKTDHLCLLVANSVLTLRLKKQKNKGNTVLTLWFHWLYFFRQRKLKSWMVTYATTLSITTKRGRTSCQSVDHRSSGGYNTYFHQPLCCSSCCRLSGVCFFSLNVDSSRLWHTLCPLPPGDARSRQSECELTARQPVPQVDTPERAGRAGGRVQG